MFHLCKQSRIYYGEAYCGPSSENVLQEFQTLAEALQAKKRLDERNPVGWNIWNATTRKIVAGIDFFSGKRQVARVCL